MRLLIDCTPLFAGGGVQVAIAFLQNLTCSANAPTWRAVVPSQLADQIPPEVLGNSSIVVCEKRSHLDRARIHLKLRQVERELRPDIVFTVFGPPYFRAKAPHVAGFALPRMIYPPPDGKRVRVVEQIANTYRGAMLRQLDHLIVETQTVKDRVTRLLGVASSRISVIGNSVNPVLACMAPAPRVVNGRAIILTPSAYYAHKNLEIIPAVAAAISAAQPNLDFEFRLTLPVRSAEWQSLKHQAQDLGVAGRVTTLGSIKLPHLGEEYRRCSIVFLPTLLEASTAVYPESFYFERPLVTSDLDFARELCGPAALYVDPAAPAQAAAAILRLMNDADLYRQQVEAGARQLATKYPQPQEKFRMQMCVLQKCAQSAAKLPIIPAQ